MVRTKAGSVSTKAVGGKAPQKAAAVARAVAPGNTSKSKHTGGNPYHPRDTPEWQKPITFFMKQSDGEDGTGEATGLPGIPGIAGNSPQSSRVDKKRRNSREEETAGGSGKKRGEERANGTDGATESEEGEARNEENERNADEPVALRRVVGERDDEGSEEERNKVSEDEAGGAGTNKNDKDKG